MNRVVFEDWFENTLTANSPKEWKVVVVMDNAKISQISVDSLKKAPIMNPKKDEKITFMSKQDIEILNLIPTKLVLLEKFL